MDEFYHNSHVSVWWVITKDGSKSLQGLTVLSMFSHFPLSLLWQSHCLLPRPLPRTCSADKCSCRHLKQEIFQTNVRLCFVLCIWSVWLKTEQNEMKMCLMTGSFHVEPQHLSYGSSCVFQVQKLDSFHSIHFSTHSFFLSVVRQGQSPGGWWEIRLKPLYSCDPFG